MEIVTTISQNGIIVGGIKTEKIVDIQYKHNIMTNSWAHLFIPYKKKVKYNKRDFTREYESNNLLDKLKIPKRYVIEDCVKSILKNNPHLKLILVRNRTNIENMIKTIFDTGVILAFLDKNTLQIDIYLKIDLLNGTINLCKLDNMIKRKLRFEKMDFKDFTFNSCIEEYNEIISDRVQKLKTSQISLLSNFIVEEKIEQY